VKVVRFHEFGGPEVLRYEDASQPEPQAGEALIKVSAVGVNYIDIYHRTGTYKVQLPMTLGGEAAGVVEAIGPGVTEVRIGDRVVSTAVHGAYAEYAIAPVAKLVPLPEGIDERQAAAVLLQGMTAHYLVDGTYQIQPGDTALIHAAAGGVGQLLVQMAKARGARVFGTTSTEEKAALVREAGADEVILYTEADFEAEVKRLTDGRGVDVVYDSVGKDTFDKSLSSLRPRGLMVLYGQSSGVVPPFDPNTLQWKGSIYLTRPTLAHYTATRDELLRRATDVLSGVANGSLKVRIEREYPLAEAAQAHRDLASRKTAGKLVLLP
jgi:NADPH2:quinone reductase